MSAFEELLRDGHLGRAGLALLLRLTRQECRRFSELEPDGGWTPHEVEDLVGSFLATKGVAVTAMLVAQATDDDVVGRILRVCVRHFLIDQVRETDIGAIRHRLEVVLRNSQEHYERVPDGQPGAGRWRLAGNGLGPSTASLEYLAEVALTVRNVVVPPWNSETRRAPFADTPSVHRVLKAVLDAASGSMEIGLLTGVFARRFPDALDSREIPLPEDAEVTLAATDPDPARVFEARMDASEDRRQAAEIVEHLSPNERRLLPFLDAPIAQQQAATGLGRSQTYRHRDALLQRLRALFADSPNRESVMSEVIRLCSPQ